MISVQSSIVLSLLLARLLYGCFIEVDMEANVFGYYEALPAHLKNHNYHAATLTKMTPTEECSMGIEMEVDFQEWDRPDPLEWTRFFDSSAFRRRMLPHSWKNLSCIMMDASVSYGVEIAFTPMTWEQFKLVQWEALLHFLVSNNAQVGKHNALQIHVSRYCLHNNNHTASEYKIGNFVYQNKHRLVPFMRRETHFAMFPDYTDYAGSSIEDKAQFHTKFYNVHHHSEYPTIELRGFLMPLDIQLFYQYVNFAHELMLYHNSIIDEDGISIPEL